MEENIKKKYNEYMSRNEAIRYLGSRSRLEKAIAAKLINPDKGSGNQKWKVKTREVIEAYKIIGNAVPPLLGYHIAKRLEENWKLYFGEEKNDNINK